MTQTVLITGVTGGIGGAIAETLLETGSNVFGTGRGPDRVQAAKARLQAQYGEGRVDVVARDLADEGAAEALAAAAIERFGRIDALVNAAGLVTLAPTHDVTLQGFNEQMNVLFRGPFLLTAAVLRHMVAAGGGVIVNIGSAAAERGAPRMAVYGAAKAALANFTRTIAAEYAGQGVRAVCISPGAVETALMDKVMLAMIQKRTPLKRLAAPREVAALVRYVLSPDAAYMTGSNLLLDGGVTL